jgi:hypothetical protein
MNGIDRYIYTCSTSLATNYKQKKTTRARDHHTQQVAASVRRAYKKLAFLAYSTSNHSLTRPDRSIKREMEELVIKKEKILKATSQQHGRATRKSINRIESSNEIYKKKKHEY